MAVAKQKPTTLRLESGQEVEVLEKEGQRYVLVPVEDYPGISESAHLLRSDANASELRKSIAWLNDAAGNAPFDTPEDTPEDRADIAYDSLNKVVGGISPREARAVAKAMKLLERAQLDGELAEDEFLTLGAVLGDMLNPRPRRVAEDVHEAYNTISRAFLGSGGGGVLEQLRRFIDEEMKRQKVER
ncbi:hypothetical protein [Paraburkholderia dipogonis]|uniref:hypothetical protein n=1 Tax=Paraburkholderia dipogonis TaxID=1211383 RepID=UPI0038BBEC4C